MLGDGVYQWTIEAIDEQGKVESVSGSITLQDGDTEVPELHNFTVAPQIFTPNQDAIADRVSVSYYLTKDAPKEFHTDENMSHHPVEVVVIELKN